MEDFRDYLEAVCQAPRLRGTCQTYVETEVTDRQRLSLPEAEFDPFGDFAMDLMVQNVVLEEKPEQNLEKDPELGEKSREKPKETIERLPVLTGICKYAAGHVLLVGRPGSGKTTALERLLVQEAEAARADSTARIPVLIRLRDLTKSTVLEQMQQVLQEHGLRLTTETIADLLWAGRFLVLLDGVNELPSGERRQEVESFRRSHQRTTPMIFTTRELNVGLDLGIEKKLEMQPLNERQMQEFTCRYLGQEQGQQLIKGLGQRLREFGQTPLLLWMLCGIYRKEREIPTNLGGVFKLFADIYNKNRFESQKSSEYSRFLQQLAWAMMPQDSPLGLRLSIPRSEAEEIFREFRKAEQESNALSGAIATLDELLRFHLLRLKDDREVEFSHQLFQEYYAGEYLLSRLLRLTDLELQKCYLNYLDWTEAVALMAGLVGDRDQALRLVRLGLEVDLMLGARLAGEVLPQFQEETVGLVTNEELPLWLKVELWGKTKSDRAVDTLSKALQDRDSGVRERAAEVLGNIGSNKAVDSLIKALQDRDSGVRERAAEALGNIGSDKAVDSLIKALQDQDSGVRRRATEALVNIGSNNAIDSLIPFLNHWDTNLRSIIVESLGNIGSDNAIDSLIKVALQGQDFDAIRIATDALLKFGSERTVDSLIKALQNQSWSSRLRGVEILGKIASERAIDSLIKALQDQDIDVRLSAAEALLKIGSERAVDSLIKALQNQSWSSRLRGVEILGEIGSDLAVDSLIKVLQDQDSDVRLSAAEALGRIGSERAVDSLIKALQDQDSSVCLSAAEALGKIGSDNATYPLIKALYSEDMDVIRKIGSDRAVDFLIKVLQDKGSNLRLSAAEALGKIGSDNATHALIKALHCQDLHVSGMAADVLVKIGSERAIDFLIKTDIQDQVWFARLRTVEALGEIGSERAVDFLINAFQDQDLYIRLGAVEALGKIGSERAVDSLIKARQDQDLYVRSRAADVLKRIRSNRVVNSLAPYLQNHDLHKIPHISEKPEKSESDQSIDSLMKSLQGQAWYERKKAVEALGNIGSNKLILQLWHIFRSGKKEALDAILKIQKRYKLYNYEISQTPLPTPANSTPSLTIYGGTFGDIVLGNKQIDVKGNYIE